MKGGCKPMRNIKEKAKTFWEDNKSEIIQVGAAGVAVGVWTVCVAAKAYKDGFINGGLVGFNLGVDWLDKTFPETNISKLYNAYREMHPEQFTKLK
jgi:hypothetical protein